VVDFLLNYNPFIFGKTISLRVIYKINFVQGGDNDA